MWIVWKDIFDHHSAADALLLTFEVVLGLLYGGVFEIAKHGLVLIWEVILCGVLRLLQVQLASRVDSQVANVDTRLIVLEGSRVDIATVSATCLAAHIQTILVARDVTRATFAARTVRAALIRLDLELDVVLMSIILLGRESTIQVLEPEVVVPTVRLSCQDLR